MDPNHFNFHLNHTQAMMAHPPPPTSSPPQSVPGRRFDCSPVWLLLLVLINFLTLQNSSRRRRSRRFLRSAPRLIVPSKSRRKRKQTRAGLARQSIRSVDAFRQQWRFEQRWKDENSSGKVCETQHQRARTATNARLERCLR